MQSLYELDNPSRDYTFVSQECFAQMLHVEQKRTERSGKSLVLMLLDLGNVLATAKHSRIIEKALTALADYTRETDVKGWHKAGSVLGIIFTEIAPTEARSVADSLEAKVRDLLAATLAEKASAVLISMLIFPQVREDKDSGSPLDSALPIEFRGNRNERKAALFVKRCMDIVGSLLAILFFSPFFVAIALVIKMTSKGPVLFRQQRVGQYGQKFEFLKFRSMRAGNNHAIHQEFVKDLIAGTAGSTAENKVFKLTDDPRITPIGRLLRRTSLDELPQFFNVLKGQMSLVGPRPPIPYEVEVYEMWHRRRLLVKPGITGLWQVKGRSRTTFDEMVLLDLKYARTWSVWMDIQILLQTPGAMVSGDGAH